MLGSGLDGYIGAGVETTYGTPVVPNRFFEFETEGLNFDPNYVQSQQIRKGRFVAPSSRRRQTIRAANGPVTMEVPTKGFGPLLNLLHGDTVVPVETPASSGAYKQTHPWGRTAPDGKSSTIVVGKQPTEAAAEAHTFPGSKITSASFSCSREDFLKATLAFDCRDFRDDIAAPTVSYASNVDGFVYTGGSLLVDGTEVEVVSEWTLNLPLPMKTDRYGLSTSGLKREPKINAYATGDGTIASEWTNTRLTDLFQSGAIVSMVANFQALTPISGVIYPRFKVTVPSIGINGETPNIDGPDVLDQSIPFAILDNGTDAPATIEYTSVDLTL